MNLIDLHTHSNASDGSLSPGDLVAYAVRQGAAAIALTDHDTVAGLPEALRAAEALSFELVPGLEISAEHGGGGMHILGYFIRHADPFFRQELERLQEARRERNPKIIARLQELGIAITYDQVLALSGGQIGRPHIAQALLQIGAVQNLEEAFKQYLTKGAPAYVEKFRFPPDQAIALIRGAGGLPGFGPPLHLELHHPGRADRPPPGVEGPGPSGVGMPLLRAYSGANPAIPGPGRRTGPAGDRRQ